jgi:hypothetical protein
MLTMPSSQPIAFSYPHMAQRAAWLLGHQYPLLNASSTNPREDIVMNVRRVQRIVLMILALISVLFAIAVVTEDFTYRASPEYYGTMLPMQGGVVAFAGALCWCAWVASRSR